MILIYGLKFIIFISLFLTRSVYLWFRWNVVESPQQFSRYREQSQADTERLRHPGKNKQLKFCKLVQQQQVRSAEEMKSIFQKYLIKKLVTFF